MGDAAEPAKGSEPQTQAVDAGVPPPYRPEIRAAAEPVCCGSGCVDCPF